MLFSLTFVGNQGNNWYQTFISLGRRRTPFTIEFEALRGSSWSGDIAIDSISMNNYALTYCSGQLPPTKWRCISLALVSHEEHDFFTLIEIKESKMFWLELSILWRLKVKPFCPCTVMERLVFGHIGAFEKIYELKTMFALSVCIPSDVTLNHFTSCHPFLRSMTSVVSACSFSKRQYGQQADPACTARWLGVEGVGCRKSLLPNRAQVTYPRSI